MHPARSLDEYAFKSVREHFENLTPTTYEASRAYLDEEVKKPEGARDLLREMCMILAVSLPKDQKVYFMATATKSLLPLHDGTRCMCLCMVNLCSPSHIVMHAGCMIFYPTVDVPPDCFIAHENPRNDLLVFEKTHEPQKVKILLAYFTRTGSQLKHIGETTQTIKVDSTPFA